MTEKQCTTCGKTKPLDEFSHRAGTADGRQYACNACKAAYQRRYRTKKKAQRNEQDHGVLAASAEDRHWALIVWRGDTQHSIRYFDTEEQARAAIPASAIQSAPAGQQDDVLVYTVISTVQDLFNPDQDEYDDEDEESL